jgi:hypothetical protein
MRTLRAITTAAAAITATLFFAQAANADRMCRQSCEGGVCEQSCGQTHVRGENRGFHEGRGDRFDRDRRPSMELRVPGVGVEASR